MSAHDSNEFPFLADQWPETVSRRQFLKRLGALTALMGAGCTRQPLEQILPYVEQPPEVVPGRALHFATAMPLGGFAKGILVKSYEGRPVKIEGNPDHPASLGSTDVFMQAAILDLYDPARASSILHGNQPRSWGVFLSEIRGRAGNLAVLTERVYSPTLLDQIRTLLEKVPGSRWHRFESLETRLPTLFDWSTLEVLVALDADPLGRGPANLMHAHQFAKSRRPYGQDPRFCRLYVAESSMSLTGAVADDRLPVRSSDIAELASQILERLDKPGSGWAGKVAAALNHAKGKGLLVAGETQPPAVHQLVAQVNARIGAPASPPIFAPEQGRSMQELVDSMQAGQIDTLLMLGGNPVYEVPVDSGFAEALERVPMRIHLGTEFDETSARSHWHIPQTHFLESWSDAWAYDGAETIMQPLIEPLFDGRSAHELLAVFSGEPRSGYEIVRDYWQRQKRWPDFEKGWRESVRRGVVRPGVPAQSGAGSYSDQLTRLWPQRPSTPEAGSGLPGLTDSVEINFRPDPCVWDGRFTANPWLQELPKPITKLTWGNAVLIGPALAQRLQLANGDMAEIAFAGRTLQAPVLIEPGHVDQSITLPLGYGRVHGRPNGVGLGFNAGTLRTKEAFWFGLGAEIRKIAGYHKFAITQPAQSMGGRPLARTVQLEEAAAVSPLGHEPVSGAVPSAAPQQLPAQGTARATGSGTGITDPDHENASLFDPARFLTDENQWGMLIDLGTCIGCNACVIACDVENNIPVVGKEQVAMGREMHWLRVDIYQEGEPSKPETHFQPVPCMHCENAPCELVCPVAATLHDSEGLNLQVYNRCVGTRYCSNNCPYKVRRFNFLEYNGNVSPTQKLQKNPQVSVRKRGVMEKCNYCVQRIALARMEARKEGRAIRDGEVVPACAQACPADAIIFGNLADRGSRVVRMKDSPLDYALLGDLNTRPRTTYLARVRSGL